MEWVLYANLGLIALVLLCVALPLLRQSDDRTLRLLDSIERLERRLRDELANNREESGQAAKGLREEVAATLKGLSDLQKNTLEGFGGQMARLTQTVEQRLEAVARQIGELTKANELRQEALRSTLEQRLLKLQEDNAAKLELMRHTVDEKLQGTLEKRLGESFKLVSERLEQVHKGLGEMQSLANGVGDLKKVLTNVKTRGTWGEVQLGNLLEQVLTPEQFAANGICREGSAERVDFVIRLPGKGNGGDEVLLPIDAKFPQEDYQRLLEAAERADADGIEVAAKALELRVKSFAKDIRTKYINPPRTTDFAMLFLPTEGLYAEVLRRPGLMEQLQQEYRVSVCGPTTLGALLNSLQMGFKTLAIQKQSSAVWEILGAVKTEFGKYGDVLDKVQKKLTEASDSLTHISVRKRAIDRKLRSVTELPAGPAETLLELGGPGDEEEPE
ncbi:DNA recombination protein RmuC [Telmatospirillum sp.]|uniref:DNA recombination protein RmuC n=1 Tax=Telmatospirillum sp. TaxID=2079197 RepID=UPI002840BF11|nr:DNA recombination protein RmuC [Telmatospirillum sp.]MDR3439166.1 DNA recombination protein RmuC [Telmatospirillum sp.]